MGSAGPVCGREDDHGACLLSGLTLNMQVISSYKTTCLDKMIDTLPTSTSSTLHRNRTNIGSRVHGSVFRASGLGFVVVMVIVIGPGTVSILQLCIFLLAEMQGGFALLLMSYNGFNSAMLTLSSAR